MGDGNHFAQIEHVFFETGAVLFEENERSFHFFIIQEGEVEVFRQSPDGKTVVLARLGPGNSIGEFAMLDNQPRSASARALTAVTAAKVSAEAYQQLLEELPEWAISVMRALVERLRATNDIVRKSLPSAREALSATEYSDTTNTKSIRVPTDDTVTDTDFDFSIYDSSLPKTGKLKR